MTIFGGLASGFNGAGPSGLKYLLQQFGVNEETIEKEVYENKDNSYKFEIIL